MEDQTDLKPCPFCAEPIRREAKVCRYCNRAVEPQPSRLRLWAILSGIGVVLIGGTVLALVLTKHPNPSGPDTAASSSEQAPPESEEQPPPPTYKSVRIPLLDTGHIVINPQGYMGRNITVTDSMRNAQIVGSFHAFGGSGNDIQAVLATPDQWENWINGHQAQVLYATPGPTTNGEINVRLEPGSYILGFSNKNAIVSRKEVTGDIALEYDVEVR
ncbi:MAG TPA: hypothetical protein VGR97_14870 [Candidatus Acidoferrales bacterium]|nr:hypothetical protein [Candidatus Acidoferrales bacterium]